MPYDVMFEDSRPYDVEFGVGEDLHFPLNEYDAQVSNIALGHGLKRDNNGRICVDTANEVEEDNTLPVTSAAVFVELGNVEALLQHI